MTDWGRGKPTTPTNVIVLDAAALWWAAAVVCHWGHVTDRCDVETNSSQSAQCGLTTRTRALHFDFQRLHTVILCFLARIFRSHLSRVRC